MAEVTAGQAYIASLMTQQRENNPLPSVGYDKEEFNREYNTSIRIKEFEEEVAVHISDELFKKRKSNIKKEKDRDSGTDKISSKFEDERLTYYVDEMKDYLKNAQAAESKMDVNKQIERLKQTAESLASSAIHTKEKDFLMQQYAKSIDFLQDEKKVKRGLGGTVKESAKEQVGRYLDVRSMFSGFVDNNPVMMALYGITSDLFKQGMDNRKERKQQIAADAAKQGIMEKDIQVSEDTRKREDKRGQKLDDREAKVAASKEVPVEPTQPVKASSGYDTLMPKAVEPTPTAEVQTRSSFDFGDFQNKLVSAISGASKVTAETQQVEKQQDTDTDTARTEQLEFRSELFGRLDKIISLLGGKKGGGQGKGKGKISGGIGKFLSGTLDKIFKFLGPIGVTLTAISAFLFRGGIKKMIMGGLGKLGSMITAPFKMAGKLATGVGGMAKKGGSFVAKKATGVYQGAKKMGGAARGKLGSIISKSKIAGKSVTKAIAKVGGKSLLKKIPGLGALFGLGFAFQRILAGDMTGAGMEALSGIAGAFPGLGTVSSIAMDAAIAARDVLGVENVSNKAAQIESVQNKVIKNKITGEKAEPTIIAPQTNTVIQGGGGGAGAITPRPTLSSARNSDSTIQRLSERFMSFGMA